jgi:hypothetical protein
VAKAMLWATEVQHRVLDRYLQLFGGCGYMTEYPIARAYADARVQTMHGGTSQIMKVIIARGVTGLRHDWNRGGCHERVPGHRRHRDELSPGKTLRPPR